MSRPVKFSWPVASTTAVCLPQTLAAAGNLILNGSLVQNVTTPTSSPFTSNSFAIFPGIARTVSLTSTVDLSGITFTITGYGINGNEKVVNITGPNATTKYTNFAAGEVFHRITSVSASAPVGTNVSIGTGLQGYTLWYRNDYHRIISNLAVSVNVINGAITYSFQTTLDDVEKVQNPYVFEPIDGVTIPTIPAGTDMIGSTVDVTANYTIPTYTSRLEISTSDATGELEAWFLNQGIN